MRQGRQLGHAWRKAKDRRVKQLLAEGGGLLICHLCRRPIDLELSGRNKMGLTLDHLHSRFLGGDELDTSQCLPAHNICNAARGSREAARHRRRPAQPKPSVTVIPNEMIGPPGMERPAWEW